MYEEKALENIQNSFFNLKRKFSKVILEGNFFNFSFFNFFNHCVFLQVFHDLQRMAKLKERNLIK